MDEVYDYAGAGSSDTPDAETPAGDVPSLDAGMYMPNVSGGDSSTDSWEDDHESYDEFDYGDSDEDDSDDYDDFDSFDESDEDGESDVSIESLKAAMRGMSAERAQYKRERDAALARLETGQSGPLETDQAQAEDCLDAGALHPAAQGLNYDPQNDTIEYKGQWLPSDLVIDHLDRQVEKGQYVERQKQDCLYSLGEAYGSDMVRAVERALPHIPESARGPITQLAIQMGLNHVQNNGIDVATLDPFNLPENMADVFTSAIQYGSNEIRNIVATLQGMQYSQNEEAASCQPVAANGTPAKSGPRSLMDMDEDSRRDVLLAAVEQAKNRLGME